MNAQQHSQLAVATLMRISALADEAAELRRANALLCYAVKAALADITCGDKWQEYNDPITTVELLECALANGELNELLPELEAA